MAASKVYFSDMRAHGQSLLIKLKKVMKAAGFEDIDFEGKFVAVKIHFGEPGNLAYLRPNWAAAVCDYVKELGGKPFLTDCNTLYVGGRKNALDHLDSAYRNIFTSVQWESYLKNGAAKQQKAREKRKAKEVKAKRSGWNITAMPADRNSRGWRWGKWKERHASVKS